jgi:hypothetical protein
MVNEVDLASAVAAELVKQAPIKEVYQDGLAPAVRETGSALADFVKTLRLALAPLQFTAALQDRYVNFLNSSVRQIPEDRRILPAPQILGPVLEAIKYEPEDTLRENNSAHSLLGHVFTQAGPKADIFPQVTRSNGLII